MLGRRKFLTMSGASGALYALSPLTKFVGHQESRKDIFSELLIKLEGCLNDLLKQSMVPFHYRGNDLYLHSSSVSTTYRGIWPDDFLYPMLINPGMYNRKKLNDIAAFLTDSIVGLDCFPDRIESDGMPVMVPGPLQHPQGHSMPLHLPGAWIRLIDYLEKWGAIIPRKEAWGRVFQRSMEMVPFSCGLAYNDPQYPGVGFGFHDTEAITGFVLISSMDLYFGLKRAIRLFAGHVKESWITYWKQIAQRVPDNLYRLYDKRQGAFFAGSKDCRQVDVWGNGLAYWMVAPDIQKGIVRYFLRNRELIFNGGFTRQITESGGWQRHLVDGKAGSYVNGGFWSVGTGWVLPAIANQDRYLAAEIGNEMVDTLIKNNFREWIAKDGTGGGASGFVTSVAVPMMGLKAIIENKPFSNFF